MKALQAAMDYRLPGPPPRAVTQLANCYDHQPKGSVTALLRKAGPFIAERDAWRFQNVGWSIRRDEAAEIRKRHQSALDVVSVGVIHVVRQAVSGLGFSVPLLGTVGLPGIAVDFVIGRVTSDLRDDLFDKIVSELTGSYGRCGGIAFSGLDFFLSGWPIVSFDIAAANDGALRSFIWRRLLDSLDGNMSTFLDWTVQLHVMPVISQVASAAIGASAGIIAGPLGAVVAAFVAGGNDMLGLGGSATLLGRTKEHIDRLTGILSHEAAWPLGFVYGSSANPTDNHQVLAIGYSDHGNNTGLLRLWDNNDGAMHREMHIDMNGEELHTSSNNSKLNDVKGIICEEYSFLAPPNELHQVA